MGSKTFFFYPKSGEEFKKEAKDNYVIILVINLSNTKQCKIFSRDVKTEWGNSCKNNIETDHRIKELSKEDNFLIYSWVSKNESDYQLPNF